MACLLTEIMPSHKSLYGNSQEQSSQKMPHIMQEHSSKTFPQIDTHRPVLLNVRKSITVALKANLLAQLELSDTGITGLSLSCLRSIF